MRNKKFIMYTDNIEQILLLTDNEAGILFKGLLCYAQSGEILRTSSRLVSLMFDSMRMRMDMDSAKADIVKAARSAAARQRWDKGKTVKAKTEAKATETETQPEPTKRFRRPSVSEIAEYIAQKGYSLDAQAIYDHYESVGWRYGKGHQPIKDWKAAVRTWNNNEKRYGERTFRHTQSADERDKEIVEQGYRLAARLAAEENGNH